MMTPENIAATENEKPLLADAQAFLDGVRAELAKPRVSIGAVDRLFQNNLAEQRFRATTFFATHQWRLGELQSQLVETACREVYAFGTKTGQPDLVYVRLVSMGKLADDIYGTRCFYAKKAGKAVLPVQGAGLADDMPLRTNTGLPDGKAHKGGKPVQLDMF